MYSVRQFLNSILLVLADRHSWKNSPKYFCDWLGCKSRFMCPLQSISPEMPGSPFRTTANCPGSILKWTATYKRFWSVCFHGCNTHKSWKKAGQWENISLLSFLLKGAPHVFLIAADTIYFKNRTTSFKWPVPDSAVYPLIISVSVNPSTLSIPFSFAM